MFTGLIQSTGHMESLLGGQLWLQAAFAGPSVEIGESIAINGCCLTVVEHSGSRTRFEETLRKTSLGALAPGSTVNLERALRMGDSMGGHIVQGHVDGLGKVEDIRPAQGGHVFTFSVTSNSVHLLVDKGSVTVDGISLTVVDPRDNHFDVWVIPHTYAVTNLAHLAPGDPVNIEFDMIAKHVARYAEAYLGKKL
jgi:riboflavin synthase